MHMLFSRALQPCLVCDQKFQKVGFGFQTISIFFNYRVYPRSPNKILFQILTHEKLLYSTDTFLVSISHGKLIDVCFNAYVFRSI